MTKNLKCIYCNNDKPITKDNWNREHVIPEAFGKFVNNFVLNDMVCKQCNQGFGDTIDLLLSRESFEGKFLRYNLGIKNVNDFKEFKKGQNSKIQVINGTNKGVLAQLRPNIDKLDITPKSQLLVKNGDDYICFEIENIPDVSYFKDKGIDLTQKRAFKILGDIDAVLTKMNEKGYKVNIEGEFLPEENEARIEYSYQIDKSFRGIAKIAFNYLAYWNGRDCVLRPEFNMIREFIYTGNKPAYWPVKPSNESILKNPEFEDKQPIVHIITVNMTNSNSLVAAVTLFNQIRYDILLAPKIDETKSNIQRGHLFDPYSKQIADLHCKEA